MRGSLFFMRFFWFMDFLAAPRREGAAPKAASPFFSRGLALGAAEAQLRQGPQHFGGRYQAL